MFPSPKGYEDKPARVPVCPEIPDFFRLHWNCFTECILGHPEGFIAVSHIMDYFELYQVTDIDLRADVLRIVRLLGAEYQRHLGARRKETGQKGKGSTTGRGARKARPRRARKK